MITRKTRSILMNRIAFYVNAVILALLLFQAIRFYNFQPDISFVQPFSSRASSNRTHDLLTPRSIEIQARAVARAFPDKTDQQWCTSKRNALTTAGNGGWSGIILVKVPKAASSTSAGVALRIAKRLQCDEVTWIHQPGTRYATRDARRSYTFMTIRDPGARAISRIFFDVSRWTTVDEQYLTEDVVLDHLEKSMDFQYGVRSKGQGGFQLRYAAPQSIPEYSMWDSSERNKVKNHDLVIELVKGVLEHYDFILVTERMDESLVAMALRMGIDVGDVLVTASKVSGSRFQLIRSDGQMICQALMTSYISPTVEAYLASDDWRAANYGDYLLHQAASASLDKTIEAIGADRFHASLLEYRRLRAIEEKECAPTVQFPCSGSGKPQPNIAKASCYEKDFGCGYKCIDEMIKREAKKLTASDID